jgi:hypothetical protein
MWALLFVAASPSDYKIHSVYESQQKCVEKQAYYSNVFDATNAKMRATCRPRERVHNRTNSIVVFKETIND